MRIFLTGVLGRSSFYLKLFGESLKWLVDVSPIFSFLLYKVMEVFACLSILLLVYEFVHLLPF